MLLHFTSTFFIKVVGYCIVTSTDSQEKDGESLMEEAMQRGILYSLAINWQSSC